MRRLYIKEFAREFIQPKCEHYVYALCNTGRKLPEVHLEILKLVLLLTAGSDDFSKVMELHDERVSQRVFNNLDKEIGLPLNRKISDSEEKKFGKKLFEKIWNEMVLV